MSFGMLVQRAGDLLIYGTGAFIASLSGRLGIEYGVNVFEGNEAIYQCAKIKKVANEFIDEDNISGENQAFPGATLSSSNYE